MSETFQQQATGPMTYPAKGTLNRILFQLPMIAWRMGLGPVQGHSQLVLTTWGRKSSLPRHTMLSYTAYHGTPYIISGWCERSDWYKNITANPLVTVQSSLGTYSSRARRVNDVAEFGAVMELIFRSGGDTHFKPMLESLDIAYDLPGILARRDRIFMLALDPVFEPGPPPMPADLTWVWGIMVISFFSGWLLGRMRK